MSDIWQHLRKFTQARIGLGRAGHALATADLLDFQLAHARAREAVWHPWDISTLTQKLHTLNEEPLVVHSQIFSRAEFLQRPDLGRKLAPESHEILARSENELVFVVSDGLSARAIDAHFLPLWQTLAPRLKKLGLSYSLVLAPFSRVALSDEVGQLLGARLAVILIGERPGLSSSDSLGIYLTYNPKVGNHDANRNCISNIRPPEGLNYDLATAKILYLIQESLRLQLSGVALKEDATPLLIQSKK